MYQTGPERMLILSIPLVLSEVLCACDIPAEFLSVTDTIPTSLIDNYYDKICNCIKYACRLTIPHSVKKCSSNFSVAGWNDVVKDKHYEARIAFLDWVSVGKPRHGQGFALMNRTRASFKLAMRYCKQNEDSIRTSASANTLLSKDFKSFWNCINKQNNLASTKHAAVVDGCSGTQNIAEKCGVNISSSYITRCMITTCSINVWQIMDLPINPLPLL